jgi:hypothetical protein
MRIVVHIAPMGQIGQFSIETVKEGMDEYGWDVIHEMLLHAAHQVAGKWARSMMPPHFVIPTMPEVQQ